MSQRIILIAVDASAHSKNAFEYYMENVHKPEDMIVICHIPEAPNLPTFSLKHGLAPPVAEWQKAIETSIDKVRKLEEEYEYLLVSRKCHFKLLISDAAKLTYKTRIDQYKNPGEGIVSVAEHENANMVIMGTRGLDRIRRTLLGSVSDYVVRHSRVPVLVCPGASAEAACNPVSE